MNIPYLSQQFFESENVFLSLLNMLSGSQLVNFGDRKNIDLLDIEITTDPILDSYDEETKAAALSAISFLNQIIIDKPAYIEHNAACYENASEPRFLKLYMLQYYHQQHFGKKLCYDTITKSFGYVVL